MVSLIFEIFNFFQDLKLCCLLQINSIIECWVFNWWVCLVVDLTQGGSVSNKASQLSVIDDKKRLELMILTEAQLYCSEVHWISVH